MACRLRRGQRMMNHRALFGAMWIAGMLASTGCASKRPSALLDRTQDERIRSEVEARLVAEPAIDAGLLRVVVNGAEVQLYGRVAGLGVLKCAITNAELVPGVRLVIDFTVLDRGPREVRCLTPRPIVPVAR